MKIGIFFKEKNIDIAELVKKEANKYGFELDDINPDIVFSVGGDGTFLKAVHKYIDKLDKITFIGINSGSLGFFYEFSKEEIASTMKRISEKKYSIREHRLLKGLIDHNDKQDIIYALNEIRIENPFHTLISDVFINNEMLETFRGNGLVVSSSVGSSAYNKSLGGALIDNEIEALELTEVAGIENRVYHSLGSSLIVKGDKKVVFSGKLGNAVVGYDSLNCSDVSNLEKVEISYSDKKVKIIYSENHTYVQKIRKSFDL